MLRGLCSADAGTPPVHRLRRRRREHRPALPRRRDLRRNRQHRLRDQEPARVPGRPRAHRGRGRADHRAAAAAGPLGPLAQHLAVRRRPPVPHPRVPPGQPSHPPARGRRQQRPDAVRRTRRRTGRRPRAGRPRRQVAGEEQSARAASPWKTCSGPPGWAGPCSPKRSCSLSTTGSPETPSSAPPTPPWRKTEARAPPHCCSATGGSGGPARCRPLPASGGTGRRRPLTYRPGFELLAPGWSHEPYLSTRSLRDYLTVLLTAETEPARALVDLLYTRGVSPEPLDPAQAAGENVDPTTVPHAWVVDRGPARGSGSRRRPRHRRSPPGAAPLAGRRPAHGLAHRQHRPRRLPALAEPPAGRHRPAAHRLPQRPPTLGREEPRPQANRPPRAAIDRCGPRRCVPGGPGVAGPSDPVPAGAAGVKPKPPGPRRDVQDSCGRGGVCKLGAVRVQTRRRGSETGLLTCQFAFRQDPTTGSWRNAGPLLAKRRGPPQTSGGPRLSLSTGAVGLTSAQEQRSLAPLGRAGRPRRSEGR